MTLLKSASKPKTQYRIAEQEVKLKAVVMFLRCGVTHTLPTSPNSDTRNQFLPVRVFHIWTVFNVLEFTVVTWPLTRMFSAMACCVEHKTVWGKDKSFFLICFLPPDCGEVKEGGEQGPCTWNTTFHEFLALHCTFPNEKKSALKGGFILQLHWFLFQFNWHGSSCQRILGTVFGWGCQEFSVRNSSSLTAQGPQDSLGWRTDFKTMLETCSMFHP